MRLDKYLGNLGIIERSKVGDRTKKGRISVNHTVVRRPGDHINIGQLITIHHLDHDQEIPVIGEMTIMLHKPEGYVSSNVEDGGHPSYRELLGDRPYTKLMNPAGRLDVDTTGLLLCTSDNELMHRIIHPNRKVGKTYLVTSMLELTDDELNLLRNGVDIEENGSSVITKPSVITRIDSHHIILTIFEGRYHQIKKMLLSINNKVVGLHRYAIGGLMINDLSEGTFTQITEQQLEELFTPSYETIHQTILTIKRM